MYKPLQQWINGKKQIPTRFYTKNYSDLPTNEWCTFLYIDECSPLHLVNDMDWISMKKSRDLTDTYLESASELINGLEGGWLDRWEREEIITNLGYPPKPSLPIYLITYGDNECEQLVYVGKTTNTSRFNRGHSIALKLHAPEYFNKTKHIYRATVWFYFNDEYISLDWIQPFDLASEILDSIESQIIYSLQPQLNIQKRKKEYTKWKFYIHIQNFTVRPFLNDEFIS